MLPTSLDCCQHHLCGCNRWSSGTETSSCTSGRSGTFQRTPRCTLSGISIVLSRTWKDSFTNPLGVFLGTWTACGRQLPVAGKLRLACLPRYPRPPRSPSRSAIRCVLLASSGSNLCPCAHGVSELCLTGNLPVLRGHWVLAGAPATRRKQSKGGRVRVCVGE